MNVPPKPKGGFTLTFSLKFAFLNNSPYTSNTVLRGLLHAVRSMRGKYFILLAVVVTPSFSCQQEIAVEPPLLLSPTILRVEPNPAKPGDVITITGQNFSAKYWENILWIGNQRVRIDSGTTSRLFARAPWGISSGSVSIKTSADSVGGPIITVVSTCSSLVCISFYNGIAITDSSAWVRDFFGQLHKWSATVSTDTITLRQLYAGGDDAYTVKILRFKHLSDTAPPLYLDGIWEVYDFPIIRTHEPMKGSIAIDRWSILGVLSGRVSTYVDYWHDWVDFNFYAVIQ